LARIQGGFIAYVVPREGWRAASPDVLNSGGSQADEAYNREGDTLVPV